LKHLVLGCALLAAACPALAADVETPAAAAPGEVTSTTVAADVAAPAVATDIAAPATACCTVPAGTVVELEVGELMNSSRAKRGDKFALRLHSPITVGDHVLVPAGATGVGEVVHAAAARGGGAPGELLLAGRYLEYGGQQWPLRGLKVSVSGKNNYQLTANLTIVIGVFSMFVRGHEIEVPMGTRVEAKLAQPMQLPSTMEAQVATAAGETHAVAATAAPAPTHTTIAPAATGTPAAIGADTAPATTRTTAAAAEGANAPATPAATPSPTTPADAADAEGSTRNTSTTQESR